VLAPRHDVRVPRLRPRGAADDGDAAEAAERWSDAEIAPAAERAYHDALDRLLALDFDTKDNEKVPHAVSLSQDGKAAWVAFLHRLGARADWRRGRTGRCVQQARSLRARFALLHHVVERVARRADDLVPIERSSVEAGVTLSRWFAHEARRIYAVLSESEEQSDIRKLYEFIQARGGRITVRELQRANCRRYPDAEAAEAALTALVDTGLAGWVEPQTTMRGGKPIKAVELCMTHDTDDTDPDDEDGSDDWPHDSGDDSGPDDRPPAPPARPVEAGCEAVMPQPPSGVIGVMRHAQLDAGDPAGSAGAGTDQEKSAGNEPAVRRSPVGKAPGDLRPPTCW